VSAKRPWDQRRICGVRHSINHAFDAAERWAGRLDADDCRLERKRLRAARGEAIALVNRFAKLLARQRPIETSPSLVGDEEDLP
jgi:hypothetical protein